MKKIANDFSKTVLKKLKPLTIVDVLRRAGIDCDLIGMEETVTGSHQITVEVDRLWNGDLSDYDGIFLPGGMPGAANLRDNPELIAALQEEVGKEKSFLRFVQHQLSWHVRLLKDKHYTCYDGLKKRFKMGTIRKKQW